LKFAQRLAQAAALFAPLVAERRIGMGKETLRQICERRAVPAENEADGVS
jgi:hypothetical protein